MDANVMNSLLEIDFRAIVISTIFQSCSTYDKLKPIINLNAIKLATGPIIEKYKYVDKTGFVRKLLDDGQEHYFFSRTRR